MTRTPCPDPQETGEAVLGLPVRPDVLRHLEECPYCRQEALVLIPVPGRAGSGARTALRPGMDRRDPGGSQR
jgi:hypothetical protein